jgi:tetratricopeptide (TPR) repeat protein
LLPTRIASANIAELVTGKRDMAEGLLGGILGGDEEKPEVEAPGALAGAEAFAAAVAAKFAGSDPEVARDTSAYLKKQAQLLETQHKHLEEEHAARLHYLLGQAREVDIRRFGLRLRVGFQLFLVLVATVIGIGVALLIHDAVKSRSVVIDPFEAPPALAAQGLTGKVLASGLLDVLTKIQVATRSSADHPALSTAWTNDISIEVPETGLSIGQIQRMLKSRFGHDQHIDGDLVQTEKGGLAFTVRGTGILPKTFVDEERDLDKLLTQGGEYVYGQSQPGLWAWYLGDKGRNAEAISFSQQMYAKVDPAEKPYVLNAWANAIVSQGYDRANLQALTLYREALRLKPDYFVARYNIMQMLSNLGDEEGVVPVGEELLKDAGGRPGRGDENLYQYWDVAVWNLQALRAGFISDMESHGGLGSVTGSNGSESLSVAQIDVLLHDVEAATIRLNTTEVDEKSAPDVAAAALARGLLASEVGDIATAAKEMDTLQKAYVDPVVSTSSAPMICFAAPIFQAAGQPAKADVALAAAGKFTFVDCTRFKGDILDVRGNWAGAQAWYAKAVKLAPSLPAGYYSWGMSMAKHGDLEGAAAKLKDANQRGPHWADPLKVWGDVLAKQGHTKEALVKYDEALKYAPNWKQLKEAREALTKQKT